MITIYLNKCKICKEETRHIIKEQSRLRGAKLMCLGCGTISHWINFKFLKELKGGKDEM